MFINEYLFSPKYAIEKIDVDVLEKKMMKINSILKKGNKGKKIKSKTKKNKKSINKHRKTYRSH